MDLGGVEHNRLELIKVDFAGIHLQHSAAIATFNSMIQIVLGIESLPWAVIAIVYNHARLETNPGELLFFNFMPYVFFLTAIIGAFGYMILVENRLMILYYARALNGYRAFFADQVSVGLPTSSREPSLSRLSGIMLLLTLGLGLINTAYLIIGLIALLGKHESALSVRGCLLTSLLVLVIWAIMVVWYKRATREKA